MEPRILTDPPPPAYERLCYGEHESQFIDFRRPTAITAQPLIVMIHGGFWRARYNLLHAGHLCAALSAEGYVTANIEYRRVGETGGGWPGTFDDVKLAVAFARQQVPARTIVIGHSAGGHLALWVAAEIPDLALAIGLAPVATLHQSLSNNAAVDLMGGTPTQVPDRYAYADPARPTPVPRVLIHGDADTIVSISLSRPRTPNRPPPSEYARSPGLSNPGLGGACFSLPSERKLGRGITKPCRPANHPTY